MIFAAANWLGLGVADWAILAVYFVVILVIGLWSITKVKTTADFFMGGRRFGKIFMMFFAFGSGTSSEQAITVVAGTWRMGLVGIWWHTQHCATSDYRGHRREMLRTTVAGDVPIGVN